MALATSQLAGQPVEEQHPVGQPGHGIGQRELPEVVIPAGGRVALDASISRGPTEEISRNIDSRLAGSRSAGTSKDGSEGRGEHLQRVALGSDAGSRRAMPGFDAVRLIRTKPSALVRYFSR